MSAQAPSIALVLALIAATPARAAQEAASRPDDIDFTAPIKRAPEKDDTPATEDAAPDEEAGKDEPVFVPGRSSERIEPTGEGASDAGERVAPPPPLPALAPAPLPRPDAGEPDAGAAAGAAASGSRLKPIVPPPRDGDAHLMAAWAARRKALETKNAREAMEQEKRLVTLREELGYENLFVIGSALCREAELLGKSDSTEALRRALLAARLAPDLPAAHWAIVRAVFQADPANVSQIALSMGNAAKASWREPRGRVAILAEVAFALLGAFLLAAGAAVVLIFIRHVRYILHDVHHLFPTGAWRAQSALTAIGILVLPLLMGFAIGIFVFGLALAASVHMNRRESVVIGLLCAAVGLAPLAVGQVEQWATFAGTRAEAIYLIDRGGPDSAPVKQVQALADRPDAPFEAVFVLGRWARRHGDLQTASNLLRQAVQLHSVSVEALVELADTLALSGDVDGAREMLVRVIVLRESAVEAHFNLARLLDRRSQAGAREEAASHATLQGHIHRVVDLDPALGATLAAEPDLRANRFLAGAPLPIWQLHELATAESHPSWVADDLAGRLFGVLPRAAGLVAVSIIALFAFLRGVLSPSEACAKCGRPICHRCEAHAGATSLCGQCVTIFAQRASVDPPRRAAKERSIRRHQRHRMWSVRVTSLLCAGAGQILFGDTLAGVAFLFGVALGGWGVVSGANLVPAPWGAAPAWVRVGPALVLLGVVWLWSARHVYRRTATLDLLSVDPSVPAAVAPKPETAMDR